MTPSGWVGTFYIMNAICLIDIAVFESFIFPLLVLVSCVFQRTGSGIYSLFTLNFLNRLSEIYRQFIYWEGATSLVKKKKKEHSYIPRKLFIKLAVD